MKGGGGCGGGGGVGKRGGWVGLRLAPAAIGNLDAIRNSVENREKLGGLKLICYLSESVRSDTAPL